MFPAAVWVEASRVSGGLCRVAMATPARFRCRCSRPQRPPSGRLLAGFCCCYHPPAFAAARPRSFLLKTTNERLRAQPACQRQSAAHTFVSSVAYASGARARFVCGLCKWRARRRTIETPPTPSLARFFLRRRATAGRKTNALSSTPAPGASGRVGQWQNTTPSFSFCFHCLAREPR